MYTIFSCQTCRQMFELEGDKRLVAACPGCRKQTKALAYSDTPGLADQVNQERATALYLASLPRVFEQEQKGVKTS